MFWVTSTSGLVGLCLIGVLILIPYATRGINRRLSRPAISYLRVMKLHRIVGFAILALVIVHMETSAAAGLMGRVNALGLDLATFGLLVLLAQAVVGVTLMQQDGGTPRIWRGVHIVFMLGILGLVIAHVYLNGMIIYSLF